MIVNQDQIHDKHLHVTDMLNEMNEVNENYSNSMKQTKYTREYMKCTKSPQKEPMFKRECVMVALQTFTFCSRFVHYSFLHSFKWKFVLILQQN